MASSEEVTLAEPHPDRYSLAEEGSISTETADPRITARDRATSHELDTPYIHQLDEYVHEKGEHSKQEKSQKSTETGDGPIYVRATPL